MLKGEIVMRQMILVALALFPVVALAQSGSSTEPKPAHSSAALQVELRQPAGLAEVALAAAAMPEAPSPIVSSNAASHAAVRESIQAQFSGDFVAAALRQGGTLEYSLKASAPVETAPKITRAVEIDLSQQELAEQPPVSNVVVQGVVDEYGVPRNLAIAQSAGPVIDKKAIAAVNQYRFKPAMVDNQPTWAAASISIKIQKQQ
jgi:hypothetical protein